MDMPIHICKDMAMQFFFVLFGELKIMRIYSLVANF